MQTFEYEIAIQGKKQHMIAIIMTKNKCYHTVLYFDNKGYSLIGAKHFIATLPFFMYVEVWHLTLLIQNSCCIMIITLKWCIKSPA